MENKDENLPTWAIGPYGIISHANEHLKLGGDVDRIIEFNGFDDAIEICIDTFITLHPKIRGGVEISNVEIEKARRNYHSKLEFFFGFVEEHKIQVDVQIEDIIWYHQLRNQLYHTGNGFTPDNYTLIGIQASAYAVFKALFKFDISTYDNYYEMKAKNQIELFSSLFGNSQDLAQNARNPRSDAELIRNIIQTKGDILLMINPHGPIRYYRFCEIPDEQKKKYGVQILIWNRNDKKIHEMTSYALMEETLEDIRKQFSQKGCIEIFIDRENFS